MKGNKKSFVLHKDSLTVLDDLTDEQAGKLFKAIKSYHLNEELELDSLIKVAFSPFKNQFIRDEEKYEKTCKARAEAGSKGGKQKQQNLANASKSKQNLANLADSDSDSDSDSEKNINTPQKPKVVCPHNEILNLWDEVMPSHIARPQSKHWTSKRTAYKHLQARWGEVVKESGSDNSKEWFKRFFGYIANQNSFLINPENKWFKLDWVVKSENFIKIREGSYQDG